MKRIDPTTIQGVPITSTAIAGLLVNHNLTEQGQWLIERQPNGVSGIILGPIVGSNCLSRSHQFVGNATVRQVVDDNGKHTGWFCIVIRQGGASLVHNGGTDRIEHATQAYGPGVYMAVAAREVDNTFAVNAADRAKAIPDGD
jgi:hypothetical protein